MCFFLHPADIVFVVKDKPHPLFKREGSDLIYQPEIPLVTVSVPITIIIVVYTCMYMYVFITN